MRSVCQRLDDRVETGCDYINNHFPVCSDRLRKGCIARRCIKRMNNGGVHKRQLPCLLLSLTLLSRSSERYQDSGQVLWSEARPPRPQTSHHQFLVPRCWLWLTDKLHAEFPAYKRGHTNRRTAKSLRPSP